MAVLPLESLPLGFRFRPTDVELIDHYLRLKIKGNDGDVSVIREVDVCKVEPWDLPDLSIIQTTDQEWFFFCPRDRKYPNGQRSNRATGKGYWKATGKDRKIVSRTMGLIGMKKTLVFYKGRAPRGLRTHWVIHEYRTTLPELDGTQPGQGAFVLCRLFKKHDDKKQDDDDGSNCDEVEAIVCSPAATNSTSLGDLQSDAVIIEQSPVSCVQSLEDPGNTDNKAQVSEFLPSKSTVPAQSHSNSYNICEEEVQFNKASTPEASSEIDDAVKCFYVPDMLFSPPHQLHAGPGPAIMDQIDTAGFGVAAGAMHFQNGDSDSDISEFLASILNNPEDYPKIPFTEGFACNNTMDGLVFDDELKKESDSCSGSDAEVTQLQSNAALTNFRACHYSAHDPVSNVHLVQPNPYTDDELFSDAALEQFCNSPSSEERSICTMQYSNPQQEHNMVDRGIKIRPRARPNPSLTTNRVDQGTANRRICLQKARGQIFEFQSGPAKPLPDVDEKGDRGIKIRTRARPNPSLPTNRVNQGTPKRRIGLQQLRGETLELQSGAPEVETKPLANDGESVESDDGEGSSQGSEESRVHPVSRAINRQKSMKKGKKEKNMDGKSGIKFVVFCSRVTPIQMIGFVLLIVVPLVLACLWRAPQIICYL